MRDPHIRLAVVGTGYFSHYHYDAWARIDGVRIAAIVYSRNRERARYYASRYGAPSIYSNIEEMIEKERPDLVDIVTTPESHLGLFAAAAKCGVPAICQKPLAPTLREAYEIAATANEHGVMLAVHENWRFKPWFREISKLLAKGVIGQVFSATFRLRPGDGQGQEAYLNSQPYFRDMPRFLMHETGVHMIDVFRYLFGTLRALTANFRRLNPVILGEDAGMVICSFANGVTALFDGNRLVDHPTDDPFLTMGDFVVEGAKGQLMLDGFGRMRIRAPGEEWVEHPYHWERRGYAGDCVFALQRHVVDHMLSGAPLENEIGDYLNNLVAVEAAYESDRLGRRIVLENACTASRRLQRP